MTKDPQQHMTARRRLLSRLAVGGGALIAGKNLPETWRRPVVDSIMLPAHAQTSLLSSSGTGTVISGNVQRESGTGDLLADLVGSLVKDAEALVQIGVVHGIPQVCVEHVREGDGTPDVGNFSAMVSYLYGQCRLISYFLSARNVPANPAVDTPLMVSPMCDPADNGDLLERLGLVREALAGDGHAGASVNLHTLTGPNGGAFGYLNDGMGNIIQFDLGRANCPGFTAQCDWLCPP